jgi:hypothetical protein
MSEHRYVLVAIPEGPQEGVPEEEASGAVVAVLPAGTYLLDIQAHWHVTGEDRQFRGGAEGFKVTLADGEVQDA